MYSVPCQQLSTACPRLAGVLPSNPLSSAFFENISPAGAVFPPAREGFESERFLQFRAGMRRKFGRRHARNRKKTISHALALSTAIFVVSVHRKDEPRARRTSQNGGWDGTRQKPRRAKPCLSMRVGRPAGKAQIGLRRLARDRFCLPCEGSLSSRSGSVPAGQRAGETKERISAT